MNQDLVTQILYQGVIVCLLVSMPAIGIGLLVGFTISLFQAVTQIHEATLTFIPKIVAIFLTLLWFGPRILASMIDFTRQMIISIPTVVQ